MLKTKFGEVLEHIATGQNSEYIANIGGVSFHGMEAELLIKFANLSDEQDARTLRHIMKKPIRHLRIGDLVFVSMLIADLSIDMDDIKADIIHSVANYD